VFHLPISHLKASLHSSPTAAWVRQIWSMVIVICETCAGLARLSLNLRLCWLICRRNFSFVGELLHAPPAFVAVGASLTVLRPD
jgi:hypothetical protein